MSFLPNECVACKSSIKPLKRCSSCQMVAYCGTEHQKFHWKTHKDVCQAISAILRKEGLSHLYEKSHGANSTKWKQDRSAAFQKVDRRMTRELTADEGAMLRFPRNCFVCHDTRQDILTNCPRCPFASFCKEHPNSTTHDRDCASITLCQQLIKTQYVLPNALISSVYGELIKQGMKGCLEPPSSMKDFLHTYLKKEAEELKLGISDYLTFPLTLFNALKKLKLSLKSEVEIHVRLEALQLDRMEAWEILMHLLPDVTDLKIVFFEHSVKFHLLLPMCEMCRSKGKIFEMLSTRYEYSEFLKQRGVQKANLVGVFNVNPPSEDDNMHRGVWETLMLKEWKDISSPLMVTTIAERKANLIVKGLKSDACRRSILYNGINEYAALRPYMEWEDGGVLMANKLMVISDSKDVEARATDSLAKKNQELQNKFFYANVCQVCRSRRNLVPCKRCKLISYCGEEHRKEHWIQHKDVCKITMNMTTVKGKTNLFDGLATTNQEVWLKTKIDLLTNAKLTKRKLLGFEEQMFLFPKTCLVCHESEFDLLTTCECGTSLCKYHADDPRHKKVCKALILAFKITMIGEPPFVKTLMKEEITKRTVKLPNSIESFMDKYLEMKGQTPQIDVPNFHKLHVSDLITRPLTLLYALEQLGSLNNFDDGKLVIHVIGSTDFELATQTPWSFISIWLRHSLKSLKVVFIGPELTLTKMAYNFGTGIRFPLNSEKSFRAESSATRYDEYLRDKGFVKPNIIIGFNLDLHESEYGIATCSWKETMLTLKKMKVPFVLTGGTEERARKDHEKLCTLLGKSLDYVCLKRNPFGGLIPERDFATEEVRYSNQYLIVYDGSYKESKKSKGDEDEGDLPNLVVDDGVVAGSKNRKKERKGR